MLKTRVALLALAVAGLAAACLPPQQPQQVGDIVYDGTPGTDAPPATLGPYTMTPFGPDARPTLVDVNGVDGVAFSPSLEHRRIGDGWQTWSHGYTGDVYFTKTATTVVLTMPADTGAFSFYAEPDSFDTFTVTAEAQNGTSSGPISVTGFEGAKYFGFYGINGAKLESVTVTSPMPFAIGEFGIAIVLPPSPRQLTELSDVHTWVGLRNSDDIGTQFDVRTELLQNGTPVASGLTRCVVNVTRNPTFAREVVVPWSPFTPVDVATGDVFSLRVSTRIGTNPDGTKCAGPGGSHNNAVGLRLYYDAAARASQFDLTIDPDPNAIVYLHSDGAGCGDTETQGVTTRTLDETSPAGTDFKCKDSTGVDFNNGNQWKVIGAWSLAPQP
jgi:hypothetical protein